MTAKKQAPTNCQSRSLGAMVYRCVCTREFRDRYFPKKVTGASLLVAPCVIYGEDDDMHASFLRRHYPEYERGTPNVHYVPSPQAIIQFALDGLGFALVPEIAVRDALRARKLVELIPHQYRLALYWQTYEAETGIFRELSDAVLAGARHTFTRGDA